MSRAGYTEGDDDREAQWAMIRWAGAIKSALRGKRGQAFLRETLKALDAMPEKRLIADSFASPDGENFCTLGVVAKTRGIDIAEKLAYDPDYDDLDTEYVGSVFGVPRALVCEIMYTNDECGPALETPEQRFVRVRRWVERQIIKGE